MLSDKNFADFAADKVVLSWENVREPVVIQHEGEKRTLGGNTVMYVVSPDGTVADAFPGVYLPEDVLPSLESAAAAAMHPAQREDYHKQRSSAAITARVNSSKMFVESSVLDANGTGVLIAERTNVGVVDLSHIAASREEVRRRLGIPESLTEDEAMTMAIRLDSQTNMRVLRPKVHDYLVGKSMTPAQLRYPMFKEFLGVHIDDPNLGIRQR